MSSVPVGSRAGGDSRDDGDVRLAWASLAGLPVAVILAFVIGEGVASWAGVTDGATASPGTAGLVLTLAAMLLAAPTALAWRFARRAMARGDRRGRLPALITTVLAVGFVAMNLLSWTLQLIT